ncbi:hypothetical protein SDC9_74485 [bioreactor metagenome]|uniref:Uncharacterized protein n=1 Tax=bioreactor metagenome TaxID=1076179 RepID=A0A644YIY3_9ZZZZ
MSGVKSGGRKPTIKLLSTRRGKIIFCILGALLSVFLIWIQFSGEIGTLLPGEARLDELNRELKKARAAEAELNLQVEAREAIRRAAEERIAEAWKTEKYGEAEVELRSKVEAAAKNQDLKLGNISTVRTSKFSNDLSFLELDVSASTDLEQLVKFIVAINAVEPKLYWRRLDFRPDNFSGTGMLVFSGTLRCLSDERTPESTETAVPAAKESPERSAAAPPPAPGGAPGAPGSGAGEAPGLPGAGAGEAPVAPGEAPGLPPEPPEETP